jgi:hypothetical protein
MACTIGSGRTEPCKDVVGGLKAVYILNFETADYSVSENSADSALNVARLDNVGTDASNEAQAYKYELKGASSYTENIQASRENGTLAFEQVLELQLKKLTKQSHKELKALSFGRPHVIIEDYNGNLFLAGREHGMEVTGGTIVTGTAMSDMSGYTLTLTGMERKPAQFLTAGDDVADTLSDAHVTVDGDVDSEFGDTDLP